MALLDIDSISIRFGGIVALESVSLEVEPGQIVGIIGPNGAGKTTVFNCITRVYNPNEGRITFEGKSLLDRQPHQVISSGVARTFQNLALFNTMSVLDNMLVGQHSAMSATPLECALRLPRARREERQARARTEDVIEFLQLGQYRDVPVAGLPFGLKKRVELGRAMVANPRLLLLDEPANGLNSSEVERLNELIFSLRDQFNLTILLVEHHMGLVMGVSDRVCVLDFGRKIADGTPDVVQNDPAVIQAYLGAGDDA